MKQLLSRLALAVGLAAPVLLAHADDQVKRGEYLARAADCMACHTAPGGAPYAGGLPIVSPFGTIYGTNITPSKEHGIGLYSDDEFFAALTEGKRRDGANLYPAMPYTSYHLIPREDSDAIHAYLKTVEPIERAAPVTSLSFPFNVRLGLMGWNMLYGKDVKLAPTEGKSEAFKRGQYMVDVLGHCGECHTPRGLPGAMQQDKRLTGGVLNGYLAPSLLANDLAARGWNHQDLSSFLKHGMSAQGTMFNEMFPVFHNSTQGLTDPDLAAMATFLLGDQPPAAKVLTDVPLDKLTASAQRGRQEYLNVCAGCHAVGGEGKPHIAVAMRGNTTLRLEDPRNLVRVIDDGIGEQKFSGFEHMQPMPGFAEKLSHEQLTDLLNYLRQSWGGQPGDLAVNDCADSCGPMRRRSSTRRTDMQHLDLQVVRRALEWSTAGQRLWLCTVLATYGSAPRAPGSLLAVNADGQWIGSLSGGCVEEDFLERVAEGAFLEAVSVVRYGEGDDPRSRVSLPCGGVLDVLVEKLEPDCEVQAHLRELESALLGQRRLIREVDLASGARSLFDDREQGVRIEREIDRVRVRIGAAQRLLLAGYSTVAQACAEFAVGLGFEVILCDPRDEVLEGVVLENVEIRRQLPSVFIADGGCHSDTAVVALTHDPRIDDLAMMEAVRTEAFYIGVMGSMQTSQKRFERLRRIGGLGEAELARIHAPIGLNLGSKTPAEIALAVLADILRIRSGIARDRA